LAQAAQERMLAPTRSWSAAQCCLLSLSLLPRVVFGEARCMDLWSSFATDCENSSPCSVSCQLKADAVVVGCKDGEHYKPPAKGRVYVFRSGSLYKEYNDRSACFLHYAPSSCEEAWDEFKGYDGSGDGRSDCYTFISPGAHTCDPECQALADHVLSNCSKGDTFDSGGSVYSTYSFFGEFHKQSACNLGYFRNRCDIALDEYALQSKTASEYPNIFPGARGVCSPEKNAGESCNFECANLVDAVKLHCTGSTFVPRAGFLGRTYEEVLWDVNDSLIRSNFMLDSEFASVCYVRMGVSLDPCRLASSLQPLPGDLNGSTLVWNREVVCSAEVCMDLFVSTNIALGFTEAQARQGLLVECGVEWFPPVGTTSSARRRCRCVVSSATFVALLVFLRLANSS